jgi:predicted esterase
MTPGLGPAPLLVALHGKGDRVERFRGEAVSVVPAGWDLFVPPSPGPAPGGDDPGLDSWYSYDGDTPRFRASLDRAVQHVLRALEDARAGTEGGPVALLGFSQGAYLAGVAAVRHPDLFRAAVLVGGRLKIEILGEHVAEARARGLRILALHGEKDELVKPGPSRESVAKARKAGLDAEFRGFVAGHRFTPEMRAAAKEWLSKLRP